MIMNRQHATSWPIVPLLTLTPVVLPYQITVIPITTYSINCKRIRKLVCHGCGGFLSLDWIITMSTIVTYDVLCVMSHAVQGEFGPITFSEIVISIPHN
jgi:hypothetical protein